MPINSGFNNFIPELWSTALLDTLDKGLVLAGLVNTDYQGNITGQGDTVHVNKVGSVTVAAYTGSLTWQSPSSSQVTLTIDNDYSFSFKVDDLDRVQANVDLLSQYTSRAAYAIADTIDQDIAAEYANAGLADINLDVGTDDFYVKLVTAAQQLDEANVPRMGRWVAVTPKGYANLLQNSNFIHATTGGDRVLATGEIGTIAGFTVFMSNNLVTTTTSTYQYMYGTRAAITHARQLTAAPEAIRLEDSFDTGVRGRIAWGNKVVQANALGAIVADET